MLSRSSFVVLALVGLVVFSLGVVALNYLSFREPAGEKVESGQDEDAAESRFANEKLITTEPDFKLNNKSALFKMNSSEVNVSGVRIKTYKISIDKDKVPRTVSNLAETPLSFCLEQRRACARSGPGKLSRTSPARRELFVENMAEAG